MAKSLIACHYCKNLCKTVDEIERAWIHPTKGLVTCCDSCGGAVEGWLQSKVQKRGFSKLFCSKKH
jgi:hypothetical protein